MSKENGRIGSYRERIQGLGSVEDVLSFRFSDAAKLYSAYLNPYLVWISRFIGFNKSFRHASGCYLEDSKGSRYLDFLSGFGSLNLGHEPPKVLEALRQVEHYPNILQSYPNPFAGALAQYLVRLTSEKLGKVFFCNSGTEACEAAIKLTRAATGKKVLVYAEGAFHGKSMGSLSISGRERYKKPFAPLLADTKCVPYGDADALDKVLRQGDAVAFIVEPIQGEAGVIVPKNGYLKSVRKICDQHKVLLILDEVQTGMGRTGRLFCYEHDAIEPDVLLLSKSLGAGVMPIGAMLTKNEIWSRAYGSIEKCLLHTSTFGGNTKACAAGIAAIRTLISENVIENAAQTGELLISKLVVMQKRFTVLKAVRGRGLMIGMTLARLKGNKPIMEGALALWVVRQLFKRHKIISAFTLNNYDVLRIAPPLIVGKTEVNFYLNALEDVLKSAEKFARLRLVKETAKV
ncbi:MAG: aspartate aminotransferase family protein [Candidatus Omnitrophica bacterium]|nr:aspartate aminotransferase family protein [Candidatus Omnitrophota bacterium]